MKSILSTVRPWLVTKEEVSATFSVEHCDVTVPFIESVDIEKRRQQHDLENG